MYNADELKKRNWNDSDSESVEITSLYEDLGVTQKEALHHRETEIRSPFFGDWAIEPIDEAVFRRWLLTWRITERY